MIKTIEIECKRQTKYVNDKQNIQKAVNNRRDIESNGGWRVYIYI